MKTNQNNSATMSPRMPNIIFPNNLPATSFLSISSPNRYQVFQITLIYVLGSNKIPVTRCTCVYQTMINYMHLIHAMSALLVKCPYQKLCAQLLKILTKHLSSLRIDHRNSQLPSSELVALLSPAHGSTTPHRGFCSCQNL